MPAFARLLPTLALGLALVMGPAPCRAQAEGEAERIETVDAREREALERQAQAAVPAGADRRQLREHFVRKAAAANRLGQPALLESVLRAAMQALPEDARWPNDLAWTVFDDGRLDEARQLFEAAMARAPRAADRLFYESNRLAVLLARQDPAAAEATIELQRRALAALDDLRAPSIDRLTTLRALCNVRHRQAQQAEAQLQLADALAHRQEAATWCRQAVDLLAELPQAAANVRQFTLTGLSNAQRLRALALLRVGRSAEAEAALQQHLDFVREHRLPTRTVADAHHALAGLHMHRMQWAAAERELRLSVEALDQARVPHSHPHQVWRTRDLMVSLWARGRHDEARAELARMDEAVAREHAPAGRGRLAFERGLVMLATGRAAEAARLFDEVARGNAAQFGHGHFYVAQARGLQGAALWADPAQREAAADVLKDAVLDLLQPRNADFLNDVSVRRPLRELVFKAYLEAATARGGLQALVAMGVADRLMAGSTSQAMADAAQRAAAADPALAALVRQEQDLRQQLDTLRGDAQAPLDDTQRRRQVELEARRQQVQDQIRARFPDYDRLLRPPLAGPTEVAQRLRRHEVLLLALPTERVLYLWAVGADELPRFARVDVGVAELQALVDRVRAGVDFDANGGRAGRFDRAAAEALFRHVVAPVAAQLQGRQHLVVATSGVLGRLPWSLLVEGGKPGEAVPWLVRRLAVSQVPGVAAWLALRQGAAARPTPEPLMAWADPRFGQAPVASPTTPARGAARQAQLPALPESRDEVAAIARTLKADPTRDLILGEQATRESVLAANRSGRLARQRVLVFATHGLMAGDLPGLTQPALALAATPGQADAPSSVIGLDDILSFRLGAEWVVLSACNTASADGRSEEALSGLARAFLYAGARSLLVTHWSVETESARLLTTATFEHQAAHPQAARAESLRQAMLRLMAQPRYAHPAFWAPFALVGEGGR